MISSFPFLLYRLHNFCVQSVCHIVQYKSKMLVTRYPFTRRYTTEDRHLYAHLREIVIYLNVLVDCFV